MCPVSWPGQIGVVVDAVVRRAPSSILDIGVGWGTYGSVLRAALPAAIIDGVEPWAAYRWDLRMPVRRDRWGAYDDVAIGLWPEVDPPVASVDYDVALMVDVLEHMGTDHGVLAMAAAMGIARALVVATPHDPMRWPQDDLPNGHEAHRRRWSVDDIARPMVSRFAIAEAWHLSESVVVVLERES